MWFELMPHGMREITDDEIVAKAEQIKAHRASQGGAGHETTPPALYPCQMPSHIHSISLHSHTFNPCGGYSHAHCHCCPRR